MARRAGARRWGPGTGEGRTSRERFRGPAEEGQWCLQKVSLWRHGVSSEDRAAVLSACLSLCGGSIESWPVTVSKPPETTQHPGHAHLPRVLGAGASRHPAPDLQLSFEHGEGALPWVRLAPAFPPRLGCEVQPQHHLTIIPLVLTASILAQLQGDTYPGSLAPRMRAHRALHSWLVICA